MNAGLIFHKSPPSVFLPRRGCKPDGIDAIVRQKDLQVAVAAFSGLLFRINTIRGDAIRRWAG
jgi:hypothetical protein